MKAFGRAMLITAAIVSGVGALAMCIALGGALLHPWLGSAAPVVVMILILAVGAVIIEHSSDSNKEP